MEKTNHVREVTNIKGYRHCFKIGKDTAPHTLYKYMELNYAIDDIENDKLLFKMLSDWPDHFEDRFYSANYSELEVDDDTIPKVHACCFTSNELNEASLQAYTNKTCVRFEINTRKLRECFEKFSEEHKNNKIAFYEGHVSYILSTKQIMGLHKKGRQYHKEFFNVFGLDNYLSLLLIKRPAFEYEHEIRFFVNYPNNLETMLFIPVNWSSVIKSILVSTKSVEEGYYDLVSVCEKKGITSEKIHPFNLYDMPDSPITIET